MPAPAIPVGFRAVTGGATLSHAWSCCLPRARHPWLGFEGPRLFLGVGLLFVPVSLAASLVQGSALWLTHRATRIASEGEANTLGAGVTLCVALGLGLIALAIAVPAALLWLTGIGAPIAAWLVSRGWQLAQAIELEGSKRARR